MENPDPSKINSANFLPHDTGSQGLVSLSLVRILNGSTTCPPRGS
jgi:hypothetical protein